MVSRRAASIVTAVVGLSLAVNLLHTVSHAGQHFMALPAWQLAYVAVVICAAPVVAAVKEESMRASPLIDIHHHVIPPGVRALLAERGVAEVGGMPVPRWDEADEVEVLDPAASAVGPVVLGRPIPWLILQALAVAACVSTVLLAAPWRSSIKALTGAERTRIGVLLVGGAVFVAWAAYWGLLLP